MSADRRNPVHVEASRARDLPERRITTRSAATRAIVVGVLCCAASPASGQGPAVSGNSEASIETDRPGNGNAATTVPQWSLQIESGLIAYAFDESSSGQSHLVSFPLALRFGVLPFLELRAGTAIIGIDAGTEEVVNPTDTAVGTKLRALRNDRWTPDLAVVADVFLPSGRGAFTAGVVVPDVRIAASWDLPAGFGLLTNAGADVPEDVEGRFARFVYVVNLNYSPPVADRRLSFFVEGFGRIPRGSREPVLQIDAGMAFLIGPDLQLDLFSQHAFTDASPDHQISLGLSARFDLRRSRVSRAPAPRHQKWSGFVR